jgi:hypothetical protein
VAITSYPFDSQTTSESQFSQWAREFQESGVADTYGGTGFVISPGTALSVNVQPGFALVRGHAINSTAVENRTLPAATTVELKHQIVLRLNPTSNAITIEVVAGVAGGGVPALTRTETGIYEVSLGIVTVPALATSLSTSNVSAKRELVGGRVGVWETDTRPSSPRYGRFGFNSTVQTFEFWDGDSWQYVVKPDTEARLAALETAPYAMRTTAWRVGAASSTFTHNAWIDIDWRNSEGASGITYSNTTGRFTLSKAGWYRVVARLTFDVQSDGCRFLRVDGPAGQLAVDQRDANFANSTTLVADTGLVYMTAGQWFSAATQQTSGSTALPTVDGRAYQGMSIEWVRA